MQDSGLNIFMPKGAMNCEKLIFAGYTNNHRVCHIGCMALYCFSHPVSGVFFYLSYAPEGVLFIIVFYRKTLHLFFLFKEKDTKRKKPRAPEVFLYFYSIMPPPHSTTVKPFRSKPSNSCGAISTGALSGFAAINTRSRLSGEGVISSSAVFV